MATVDLRFLKKNADGSWRSDFPNGDLPDTGYDVYWLIGQSNMIGRPTARAGIDDVYTEVAGKVFQYGYNALAVSDATNPLDHNGETAGDMGLWLEFSKARLSALYGSRKILLVPAARGGTGFVNNYWNVGDTCYVEALARLASAMAIGPGPNYLRGALWLQGESDADGGTVAAAAHAGKFQTMYNSMVLNAVGMTSQTPFIVGTIKPDKPNATAINNGYSSLVATIPALKLVSLTDLSFMDSDHYDAASLYTAGQRYASKF